jgi:23S rRNA (cytidine1920-2'-O)/16S rRNA (cytidine1409-2'-O)-methyltransferase
LSDNGCAVTLIKPQFEVGRENVGDGVITDTKIQNDVIKKIESFVHDLGFLSKEVIPSPIKGTKGNTEFLIMLEKRR